MTVILVTFSMPLIINVTAKITTSGFYTLFDMSCVQQTGFTLLVKYSVLTDGSCLQYDDDSECIDEYNVLQII